MQISYDIVRNVGTEIIDPQAFYPFRREGDRALLTFGADRAEVAIARSDGGVYALLDTLKKQVDQPPSRNVGEEDSLVASFSISESEEKLSHSNPCKLCIISPQ